MFLFGEHHFSLEGWKWLVVAVIFLFIIVLRRRREIFDTLYPPFDMDIASAVDHLVLGQNTFENEIKSESRLVSKSIGR